MATIEWMKPGNNAVITGGANGIGLAAAEHFASQGMNVIIADRDDDALNDALQQLKGMATEGCHLEAIVCDVSSEESVAQLYQTASDRFETIHCLMNNAGASTGAGMPWEDLAAWKQQLDINLWGVIHGCQAFLPAMIKQTEPSAVINTGSKQGITNPPGNYAYNLSKAGVLAYSQSLAHALRNLKECQVSTHLLVPGFTYSGMIARHLPEKPPAAWTTQQTVAHMVERLEQGDFYILCPDNDVSREMDEKRIQWNADDLILNRPALSRWHPEYTEEFDAFMKAED